ncbi:MAG: Gfo/Idh/MocA family oxidoreductase [Anaerocolumna sp.]
MGKKINVGIVGFGYMGKMHAMCYDNIKYYYNSKAEVNLYAVVSSKKPEELPVKFEKYYSSIDEMLEDEQVEVVDICGPNYQHKELLLKAIAKNKHIYCEKPLTLDLESAEEVIGYAKKMKYEKVSRVTYEYRFVPAILRAKQIIEEGGIGKIIHFNFKYYGCEFLDPNRPISWQSTKELSGGGVLYAMGTHSIDLIRYLVGDVKEVFAQKKTHFKVRPLKENPSVRKDVEIEDIINVQLTCQDEIMGSLLLSQVAAGSGIDFTFELYGEKGALKFDHENANVIYYYNQEDPKDPAGGFGGFKAIETTQKYGGEAVFPPPRVTIAWSRYHIASIYDFLHAIETGTKAYPDIEDGYKVQQITDAIYKSADTGKIRKV